MKWLGALGCAPVLVLGAALSGGCGGGGQGAAEHWPADGGGEVGAGADLGGSGGGSGPPACVPAPRTSEDLAPRVDLINLEASAAATAAPAQQVVKTSELFQRFNTTCGMCHVSATNGGFHVSDEAAFVTLFDATRLARIESEDPSFAMPPTPGRAFSTRTPDDPVYQLAKLLEAWLAQGRPVDMFVVQGPAIGPAAGVGFYAYSTLTNMGECIPAKTLYASSPSAEMDAKDTFFASATSLPLDLADTDLTTFDGAALAANGVIAFRPTYALWSAGSGKLRYVRVPKGTSIKFDKATQTFDIPPNTRFYKTFFRKVKDSAGRTAYRKMETRLIVARPDTLDTDGKTPKPNALFGTYIWSDDEMSAQLRTVPYRDQTPFADLTAEYVTDEIAYHDVITNLPPGAGTLASKIDAELADPRHLGLVQHYAVPGSLRCIQCHRGSPSKNFVLGFLPVQIAQRAAGTGGTYDPVATDELNQLQRFIDYGLITGMVSPADVARLEDSQLPRKPRTDGELKAQAYMVGNCAHCHNPRGYPSLAKPDLATVLNFLPGTGDDGGGIFQFPLERVSPLRQRGANQDVPIPYITPSLRDYPVADLDNVRLDNGAEISPGADPATNRIQEVTWTPKYIPGLEGPGGAGCAKATTPSERAYCGQRKNGRTFVSAPWRSLIYRNVDTPFPYFDDYVPFPHMPMNTAGFDCRAPRIMGDWMVGLPAQLKPEFQDKSENALPGSKRADGTYDHNFIDGFQPYEEVLPSDTVNYPVALANAGARLAEYHGSVRYPYCPDALSPDILDPLTAPGLPNGSPRSADDFYPQTSRFLMGGVPPADPVHPSEFIQPAMGVPYHAEWFDYDPTDSPPPWQPRRVDWKKVLIDGTPDDSLPAGQRELTDTLIEDRRRLTTALQAAQLQDDLVAYATTPVPYGLWAQKPECNGKLVAANNVSKVSDIPAASQPDWMRSATNLSPDAPVYKMAPGFALYRHICINCHGPRADGKGLQGDALAASSEGRTRPANLAAGLFGPADDLGADLLRVFGGDTADPKTATTWAPRYVAWMTLGGTLQLIPSDIVNQVQATRILGETRKNLRYLPAGVVGVSANMLNLAKGLCAEVLPDDGGLAGLRAPVFPADFAVEPYPLFNNGDTSAFIRSNGDWEMWMNLCSRFNRQVVRVYGLRQTQIGNTPSFEAFLKVLYYADGGTNPAFAYPADAPVWDHTMKVQNGVTPFNYFPACFQEPDVTLPGDPNPFPPLPADVLATFKAKRLTTMPSCPTAFLQHPEAIMFTSYGATPQQTDAVKEWTLRGAINAAMTVFSFLRNTDLTHNELPPYYNECQKLPTPPTP